MEDCLRRLQGNDVPVGLEDSLYSEADIGANDRYMRTIRATLKLKQDIAVSMRSLELIQNKIYYTVYTAKIFGQV